MKAWDEYFQKLADVYLSADPKVVRNDAGDALRYLAAGYGPSHGGVGPQPSRIPHQYNIRTGCCRGCGEFLQGLTEGYCNGPSKLRAALSEEVGPGWKAVSDALKADLFALQNPCTCPLSGPDGLMARGCQCGGT